MSTRRRRRRGEQVAAVLAHHPAAARPAILVTLIFRTLDALRVFDVFYVMFGTRRDTQTMAIYNQNTIVTSVTSATARRSASASS